MSENLPAPNGGEAMDRKTLLAVVTAGDLSALTDEQRTQYYLWRCEAAGLDPRSTPFQYLVLGGKTVLYATRGVTDQLALKHRLTLSLVDQRRADDLYVVTARAQDPSGRYSDDVGVVVLAGLRGIDLANALMKAVTKAKRRAVLSLVGLGVSDESEFEDGTPASAAPLPPTLPPVDTATGEVLGAAPPAVPAQDRMAEAAKARAGRELHAVAREHGIDTNDREAIHRVCSMALDREVESVIDLDAADRAITAAWIRANPEAARALAGQAAPPEKTMEVEDGETFAGEPRTLLAVQAAETTPSYSGLIQ